MSLFGTVICLVDYNLAGCFFIRLAESDRGKKYIFITTSLSFYISAKNKGFDVHLISWLSKKDNDCCLNGFSFDKTREIKLGLMPNKKVIDYAARVTFRLSQIIRDRGDSQIVIFTWNGNNSLGEIVRFYTKKYKNLTSLFFEISNLQGKLFIDPNGVNASASIYDDPSLLNNYDYDKDHFNEWKKNYLKNKLTSSSVPQVKKVKELKPWHLFDFLFYVTIGYATFPKGSIKNKLSSFFKPKKKNEIQRNIDLPDEYVFFPMQVSSDTQIKLNSDTNNYDALKYLIDSENLPIVIKPHPAEPDFDYINDILSEHSDRVFLTTNNTYELIQKAKKVVTINSTVGFEAMLFEKEVVFLGRSFYKNFTPDLSGAYVMSYLVDINFFDSHNCKIPLQQMSEIYGRAKWT